MDISRINNNYIDYTLDSTKSEAVDNSFEKSLQGAVEQNDKQRLKKVCQEFESIMLNMMYKQMKATVPKSDLIPGDVGRDIFESMLDENLVNESSKNGGFGLSEVLYKQISRQLEATYAEAQYASREEQTSPKGNNTYEKTEDER